MFAFSCAGMFLGLAVDAEHGRILAFATLCESGGRDWLGGLRTHWLELPWMHGGMLAGAVLAMPYAAASRGHVPRCARAASHCLCCVLMLAGMNLAMLPWQGGVLRPDPLSLAGVMTGGMAWSMALWLLLERGAGIVYGLLAVEPAGYRNDG
ncbi:hypothetical protein [Rudaea sp.]|uniref:hypothetical protein n=1 Tax=Rudaea sp. TaxID=2136325 RepID=UPI002ED282BD